MEIGKIIKKERKKKGLTQTELAEAVGVSQAAIAKYEAGVNEPSFEMVSNIAKVLGFNPFSISMMALTTEKNELLAKHRNNGYRIGDIAKLLNSEYPPGCDWSFADFSYYDAMDATINALCLEKGFLLEIIKPPQGTQHAYHVFNETDSFMISEADIYVLWNRMVEHMNIDFMNFINSHNDNQYRSDEE